MLQFEDIQSSTRQSIPAETDLQRETTFQTRCTISSKVCSLIINGGSCTNVASQTMVDKLQLPTVPHQSPYVLEWLNQGKGIIVSNRVLLTLSIGHIYADEIWCDVLPMESCHVLLGRPWLFDRRVMHDGFKNTYSFVFNNHRLTLTPISPTKSTHNPHVHVSTLITTSTSHEFKPINKHVVATDVYPKCGNFMENGSDFVSLLFKESENHKEAVSGQLAYPKMKSNVLSKSVVTVGLHVSTKTDSNNELLNQIFMVPTLHESLVKLYGYRTEVITRILACVFTTMGSLQGNNHVNYNDVHYTEHIPPEPPPKQVAQHKMSFHAIYHTLRNPWRTWSRFMLYAIGYPPEIPPEPPPDHRSLSLRTNFFQAVENDSNECHRIQHTIRWIKRAGQKRSGSDLNSQLARV